RSKSTVHLCFALLLVVLCVSVYGNVLSGEFIWDDQFQVVRNASIHTVDIRAAFTSSLWSFMYSRGGGEENRVFDQYYRPMQTVTYALAYRFGGLSPFVYHVVNLVLHSAATLLIYLLSLELGLVPAIAFMAA